MNRRVAVVVSHPIQHFCPQYSSWARIPGIELKVFFASRHGLDAYWDEDFAKIVSWDNLTMDFPHEFLPGATDRTLTPGIDCRELPARLSEFAPNLLIAYGYTQPLQRRALRWARSRKVPRAMIGDSELRTPRSLLTRMVKSVMLPRVFGSIDVFLTVGDSNETYYRNYGVPDCRLVRSFLPIDIKVADHARLHRSEIRARLRAELGIPVDHPVILMVGKLVPWKRQVDLVEFSNRMRCEARDMTVILAGTGADEQALRKRTNKTGVCGVLFAGFVPPAKLVEYYLAADVYVHCSAIEPHSLAVSEAIYSGLPVVLSDRCGSYGPTDDVRPGLNGFVYPSRDVDALAKILTRIFADTALRQALASASTEIARANQELAHGKALIQALELISMHGQAGS